jgi:arginyl-tRNA synthetase
MRKYKQKLQQDIYEKLKERYPIDRPDISFTYPPQIQMGDLALAFAFQLAKKTRRNPRELALEISPLLAELEDIQKVDAAGGGYINIFLDKDKIFKQNLSLLKETSLSPEENKIIVEHTSINPNKAAHIGHLRNACLGDTLVLCLKYKGESVEIQNYIDDTGVQVADVVFGFMDIEKKNISEIKSIKEKFDYYCWDLYARATSYLEEHPEAQKRKAEILKKIEEGIDPEAEIGHYISQTILKAHLKTMRRLNIGYDLQACESSILGLKFWEHAFSLLKEKEAIYYAEEGVNQGCWVMKSDESSDQDKIIVRSDGTVTYVGKDIAYQLWKCGLLDKDFFYQPFLEEKDGKIVWITTSSPTPHNPKFGNASMVFNVIDTRQSYTQKVVVQGLRVLGFPESAEKSIHFSYEMVALSPNSLDELNQYISEEDRQKDFLEVSGRKGLGIKADDLIDKMEERALKEVSTRNPDLSPAAQRNIARDIAVGALRYFMLKFARNSIIVFDFEDALNFEGETGPYLQYTNVRIKSIFRKLVEREGFTEKDLKTLIETSKFSSADFSNQELDDFWDLVLYASQLDEEVLHSLGSLEFLHLAKFAFNLCQKFNAYYHKYPILSEQDQNLKELRILTIYYIQNILEKTLTIMGIPQPDRM